MGDKEKRVLANILRIRREMTAVITSALACVAMSFFGITLALQGLTTHNRYTLGIDVFICSILVPASIFCAVNTWNHYQALKHTEVA